MTIAPFLSFSPITFKQIRSEGAQKKHRFKTATHWDFWVKYLWGKKIVNLMSYHSKELKAVFTLETHNPSSIANRLPWKLPASLGKGD